jgi:hypothetical protein
MQKAIRRGMEKEAMQFAVELMHISNAFHSMVCRKPITSADGSGCMSKRSSIMLEEVIKLHRFAGISPEKSLTEAGCLREAMVAADQSMVIRCFGDDLAGLVDDDFHALPPVQRPLGAAAMLRDLSNLAPAPAFQCKKVADFVLPCATSPGSEGQLYFRLRRVRFRLRRLAFAATFLRYCSTILSRDAPAIRLVPAFAAASTFSLTMRWASRWAALPPRINLAMRSPITRLLSSPSIIQFHML